MLTADLTKQKGLLNSKDKSIKNIQIKAQVEINEKKIEQKRRDMQNIVKWSDVYAVESQKEKRKKMELQQDL